MISARECSASHPAIAHSRDRGGKPAHSLPRKDAVPGLYTKSHPFLDPALRHSLTRSARYQRSSRRIRQFGCIRNPRSSLRRQRSQPEVLGWAPVCTPAVFRYLPPPEQTPPTTSNPSLGVVRWSHTSNPQSCFSRSRWLLPLHVARLERESPRLDLTGNSCFQ